MDASEFCKILLDDLNNDMNKAEMFGQEIEEPEENCNEMQKYAHFVKELNQKNQSIISKVFRIIASKEKQQKVSMEEDMFIKLSTVT